MDKNRDVCLKVAIFEIINGYSKIDTLHYRNIYIKHFSLMDVAEVNNQYNESYIEALKRGLPTSEQQIQAAVKEGDWTEEKEKLLKEIPSEIANQKLTLSRVFLSKVRENISSQIKELELKLSKLEHHRAHVIGYCAETYASNKTNEFYVYYAFRKKNLKNLYFTKKHFEELEQEELNDLVAIHNTYTQKFEYQEIKHMAISVSFMNMIAVAGEDVYSFYGKPVVQLTNRQIDIYRLGRYYRQLLTQTEGIPEDISQDPDRLVDFVESTKKAKEVSDKIDEQDASGVALVGATQEDLDKMGLKNDPSVTSLQDEAAKQGKKSLDMNDMLKLHGLI